MSQATTLGHKAITFNYSGNVQNGVVINYDSVKVQIDRTFFHRILMIFSGKKIWGGFAEDNPTPKGFGEWIRDNSHHNSCPLTPRHASRIAAILVAEKYATSNMQGNAVFINFSA